MDEDELRQFYMAAGAALAIGDFIVLATNAMTLAVTRLPHGTPWLAYADFGVAAVGLFGGATIIARALMGKSLFGSKRARRVGNDRLFTEECLGALLSTGQNIASRTPEEQVLAANWSLSATTAVAYFYGHARANSLLTGMTISKKQAQRAVQDIMQPLIHRLTSIIDQAHTLKLPRGFDRSAAKRQEWYQFLLTNCPYNFEEMLPTEV